jgi:mevalonate kinase
MAISAESSGKLLLFGEHAALYGYPALGMALPWSTRVTISEDPSAPSWTLPFLAEHESSRLGDLIKLMFELFPLLGREGYSLMIESNIPRGVGFGSSAALCVALVKAVFIIVKDRLLPASWFKDSRLLWSLANRAERLFHGRASGIDTGLSLFGEMQGFSFDTQTDDLPQTREMRTPELLLVVGAVPRDGNTKRHVVSLMERFANGDSAVRGSIQRLGSISEEAFAVFGGAGQGDSLAAGEHVASILGRLADQAEGELEELGLGNDILRQALALGRAAGASGGKTSGAGGGGAFYLVAKDMSSARAVHATLTAYMRESGLCAQPLVIVRRANNRTYLY